MLLAYVQLTLSFSLPFSVKCVHFSFFHALTTFFCATISTFIIINTIIVVIILFFEKQVRTRYHY